MTEKYPTRAAQRYCYLLYGSHICAMTGKDREPISLEGVSSVEDLLFKLDAAYEGIKDLFIPPGGIFNSKTAILLRRSGESGKPVLDQKEPIRPRDVLLLW